MGDEYKGISKCNPAILTIFDGVRDMDAERAEVVEATSFEDLVDYLSRPPKVLADKNAAPFIVPARCKGGRKRENIDALRVLVLDIDKVVLSPLDAAAIFRDLLDVDFVLHTTHSHGLLDGRHSYRVWLNHVAESAEEVEAVVREVFGLLGIEPTPESWNSLGFFGPSVHPQREDRFERYSEVCGNPIPSRWALSALTHDHRATRGPKTDHPRLTSDVDMDQVRDALHHVTDDDGNRDRWLQIGMALHSIGHPDAREVWDEWSERQDSGKYDPQDQGRTWESFSARGNGARRVTVGTIYHLARKNGWRNFNQGSAREDFSGVEEAISSDREASLLQLNDRYAYLSLGQGKVVDLGAKDGSIRFLNTKAFTEMMNYPRWPAGLNGRGVEKAGTAWLHNWEGRPTYDRIDFIPPGAKIEAPPSTLNLWRRWKYEDAPVGGSCDLFLNHVRGIICGGDEHVFAWVLAWMGHLVQKPGEKPGTAIVLRGIEGTGKGIFANTVRELCGPHGIQVTHPRQLTGNFNHHLADKLLVFADEVTWGGYKKDDGVLKTMITEPTMVLEAKGVDSIEVRSFCRVIISSNNTWVVPTGPSSRRFLVLDVSDARVGDSAYFKSIVDQLLGGGYAALWRHLRDLDLTQLPDPTKVIRTAALRDQKLESLDDRGKWVLEFLQQGELDLGTFDDSSWPTFAPSLALYENYQRFVRALRTPRVCTPQQLSAFLKDVFGSRCLGRRTVGRRQVRGITLPPLDEARRRFEAWIQSSIEWED